MLTNFITFALRPRYVLPLADAPEPRTGQTIRLFLAEYPLFLSTVLLSMGVLAGYNYFTGGDSLRISSPGKQFTPLTLIMTVFLLVLFIEWLFRSMLRLTPGRLSGMIWLGLFVLVGTFTEVGKRATNEYFTLWALLAWLVLSFLLSRYLKRPAVFARIEAFWQRHFRWIFYGMTLLYGLFWMNKTEFEGWQVLLFPVLLMSGLFSGLYLGYVRMRFGFWYAVVVQALIMSVPLTLELLYIR